MGRSMVQVLCTGQAATRVLFWAEVTSPSWRMSQGQWVPSSARPHRGPPHRQASPRWGHRGLEHLSSLEMGQADIRIYPTQFSGWSFGVRVSFPLHR